jgi:hypothetical protein
MLSISISSTVTYKPACSLSIASTMQRVSICPQFGFGLDERADDKEVERGPLLRAATPRYAAPFAFTLLQSENKISQKGGNGVARIQTNDFDATTDVLIAEARPQLPGNGACKTKPIL